MEKIVLENFKSYRGKHVVGPFHRFTCIIGPNGCGKSNIMDAISFALGINSQHLRSENILNLVNKKCDGDAVSVTLVFRDTIEYRLTREIRSSKTLYLIDGNVINYDDYKKFLESKNIFVKIRNFLVFQSDVGSIAMKTPKELCKLFEEISGSIDFKEEYEAALVNKNKAIADCSYALELKKDMMNKVKEIEREKEHEKNFKRLMARKEALQQKIVLNELSEKGEQIRETNDALKDLEHRDSTRSREVEEKQQAALDAKLLAAESQKEFFRAESYLNNLRDELKDLQNQIVHEEERSEKAKWELEQIKQKIRNLNNKASEKEREKKLQKNELDAVESGFKILVDEHEKKKNLFTTSLMEKFYEEESVFNELIAKEIEELNELRLKHLPMKRQKESNLAIVNEMSRKLKAAKEELANKQYTRENIESRISRLKNEKKELEKRISKSNSQYQEILSEEKQKNNELTLVMEQMIDIKIDHRESGKKALIKNTVETLKAMFKGVYGRVGDLVKPTQKKYEVALSSLFGSYYDAVVVENDSVALSAIEYIKERKLCKLTFLPLKSLKSKDAEMFRDMDQSRPAVDTVIFEDRFKIVVNFVLKDSLIVDTLHKAKETLYVKGIKVKVCTLDGTIFHKNGFITGGGAKSKFESAKAEELGARRNKLMKELRDLQATKSQFSETEIVLERIKRIDEQVGEEEAKLAEELVLVKMLNDDVAQYEEAIERCEAVIRESSDSKIVSRMRELERFILEREATAFSVFRAVGAASLQEFKNLSSPNHFVAKKLEYEGLKMRIESRIRVLEDEIREIQEDERRLDAESAGARSTFDRGAVNKRVFDLQREAAENEKRLSVLGDEVERKIRRVAEFSRVTDALAEEKQRTERQILQLTSTKARLDEDIAEMIRFAYLEEIEIPMRSASTRLEALRGLDDVDFSGFRRENVDVLKKEMDAVNREIDENVLSIKTGTAQKVNVSQINADYERCKNAVIASREEFNYARKRRAETFMLCFNKISETICAIYKELTHEHDGEGNAFLILDDAAEPFNGGVQFHVMPPKKRFREINLLSGGEKTMASLALIFALHGFRPAPFYVFDELDSALDKSNVAKLVAFLRNLSVQLVVITLKPQVFQCAEALVGVYKDRDRSSSRVLSYKLE